MTQSSDTPVTQPTIDDWKKVDELSAYTSQPNTTMEWAQYADRLRCALAEQLVLARSSSTASSVDRLVAASNAVLAAMDDYNEKNGTSLGGPAFFELGRAIASLANTPAQEGESERCQKCGHLNPSWAAPSPLWNAVMRGGLIDGEPLFSDMVCASCFMELADHAGIASNWRVDAQQVNVPLETATPSGRVWDAGRWLWVHPDEAPPAQPADETERQGYVATVPPDCDRIAWRGSFYALAALANTPTASSVGVDVEAVARALFVFQHQGDIADPGRTWDAPDKGEHPIYWQQKMEHYHPHYRAMAAAALAASSNPAGAMDTLQWLGQEYDGASAGDETDPLTEMTLAEALARMPTADRAKEISDKLAALERSIAASRSCNTPEGPARKVVVLNSTWSAIDDAAWLAIVASQFSRALSATPTQPVDETERLRRALDGVDCITRLRDELGGKIELTWLDPEQSWPMFNLLSEINSGTDALRPQEGEANDE